MPRAGRREHRQRSLDDTDLVGDEGGSQLLAPGKISDGGLRLGLVIDDAASDEQAAGLERIFSSQVGGMFGQFTGLTERWIGTERAAIAFSDGDEPSATIGQPRSTSPRSAARTATSPRPATRPSASPGVHPGQVIRPIPACSVSCSKPATARRRSSSGQAAKASSAHSPSPAESPAVRFPPLPMLTNLGLIGLRVGLAIVSWALTDQRMAGMDAGPVLTRERSGSTSSPGS